MRETKNISATVGIKLLIALALLAAPVRHEAQRTNTKAIRRVESSSARIAGNESSAIKILRAIHSAEATYQATTGNGKFGSWRELAGAGLLPKGLADKKQNGYRFRLYVNRRSDSPGSSLLIVARPGVFGASGRRSFSIDELGQVRSSARRNLPAAMMRPLIDEGGGIVAHEASAVSTLRTISVAEAVFQSTSGNGDFGDLKELIREQLIHPGLTKGIKNGYSFKVLREKGSSESLPSFAAFAAPVSYGKTGRRSFYIDESGVIRVADRKGFEANVNDQPLDKQDPPRP